MAKKKVPGATSGNDVLVGTAANELLDGKAGMDKMAGGLGDDDYVIDNAGDTVIENAFEGTDLVTSSVTIGALFANVENATLSSKINGKANLDLTGNALTNILIGNLGNNTLDGAGTKLGKGPDTLSGLAGDDTYIINDGNEVLIEANNGGNDSVFTGTGFTLADNIENLTGIGASDITLIGNKIANTIIGNNGGNGLYGMAGDDILVGGSNGDYIDGGTGNDKMSGGDGSDTYVVDSLTDTVTEAVGEGEDTVNASVSFTLGANVDNLTFTTGGNFAGTGNDDDNTIIGNSGSDLLVGGKGDDFLDGGSAGSDVLQGGVGDDYYVVSHSGVTVTEGVTEGTDTVETFVSFTAGSNIENLIVGTGANDTLVTVVGNSGNNVITDLSSFLDNSLAGMSGADIIDASASNGNVTLDGGTGSDSLIGGSGNNTFIVDETSTDLITENAASGIDTIISSVNRTIDANVENLTLTGSAVSGTGNAENNTIIGNSGSNVLSGLAGADYLDGGTNGDVMLGGDGDDTYVVDNAGDSVTEIAGEGTADTVYSSVTYILGSEVENLFLTGSGNINGTGNAVSNSITGNSGNNTIDGGAGAGSDAMAGGAGDDTFFINSAGDTVTENVNEGTDTVHYNVELGYVALADNVENLVLEGSIVTGLGNSLANKITGNGADNSLDGGAGVDILIGNGGNDTYIIDDSNDFIVETTGTDTVYTNANFNMALNAANVEIGIVNAAGNLNLTGNNIANQLTGNSDNNTLDGGVGADTLVGNGGNDSFGVDNVGDTATGGAGNDTVISSINWDLTTANNFSIENLTLLAGSTAVSATGDSGSNIIIGNAQNNIIDGGTGADSMYGGAGDDTFAVDDVGDTTNENTLEGNDTVNASVSHTIGANIENLNLTAAGLTGTGNAIANSIFAHIGGSTIFGMGGNDVITGLGGDDSLDGGTGADFLIGGAGKNIFFVDQIGGIGTGDFVDNGGGAAGGTINSTVSWNLADGNTTLNVNILNLIGTGTNLVGTGTGGVDTLTNNTTGANVVTLNGGAGADVMVNNNNTVGSTTLFIVDNAGDATTGTANATDNVNSSVSHTLGAGMDNLTLTGANSSLFATGNAGVNIISSAGNTGQWHTLDGGNDTVADTLVGSSGTDYFIVRSANDVVIEVTNTNADDNADSVTVNYTLGGFNYTLGANVENGIIAAGPDVAGTLTGNSLNNILTNSNSFSGSTLDGGVGADNMTGNSGNDTFVVDNVLDLVNSLGGIDTVLSSINYSAGSDANLENVTLRGGFSAALVGTGNALVNIVTGNEFNNTLNGMAGADTLVGGLGNDLYIVDDNTGISEINAAGETGGTDTVQSANIVVLDISTRSELDNITVTGNIGQSMVGNAGVNVLTGDDSANLLDGGAGADTLIGGIGNDTYVIDVGLSEIATDTGGTSDLVQTYSLATIDISSRSDLEHIQGYGATNYVFTGNASANILAGDTGNDTLNGGTGFDTLVGGAGDDLYIVDQSVSEVFSTDLSGTDTVQSSAISLDISGRADLENATLTGASNFNLIGNGNVNILTGNSGNNSLNGAAGVDTLIGGGGNDTFFVDNGIVEVGFDTGGTDTVISSGGGVDLSGRADIENATVTGGGDLIGNASVNILTGDGGSNAIDGLGGNDTMIGGGGNDAYYVRDSGDVVTELAGGGANDLVYAFVNYTLASEVEEGNAQDAITLTGNSLDNALIAYSGGGSTIDGGTGADLLIGDVNNDTFVVDNVGDVIGGTAGGTDTIRSSIAWDLNVGSNGALNLVLTGSANINGTGDGSNNSITGNSGNNVINGGAGQDVMAGLGGNDTYFVDDLGDTVTESSGGGTDTVNSSVDFTLGANVENLALTGKALYGYGNASNNNITAVGTGVANNVLDGKGGADAMTGGDGDDVYYIDDLGDQVFENANEGFDAIGASVSHTMEANVEQLVMTGTDNINATGNALNNVIIGNTGNNTLDGGAGTDILTGGVGDDTYVADAPGDVLNENDLEGTDTVIAGFSATLQDYFENLTLSGALNLNATGNGVANIIHGNSGNNSLDGAAGADAMSGHAGNDTYFVDNLGDTVTEAFGEGQDVVHTLVNFSLGANVEDLIVDALAASDLVLNGNGDGNFIDASLATGNSTINGGSGADYVIGAAGDDLFYVDDNNDVVIGQGGNNLIVSTATFFDLQDNTDGVSRLNLGGGGNISASGLANVSNTMTGNGGSNVLIGGSQNDTLDGGGGVDQLVGGAGDDIYYVDNTGDIVTEFAAQGNEDFVYSTATYTLGLFVDGLELNGGGNINGTGNGDFNVLIVNTTGATTNTLNGGAGADLMINQNVDAHVTFVVDNEFDNVQGLAGSIETVLSSVTYVLDAVGNIDVDNVTLTGTFGNGAFGNSLVNVLTGNSGDNLLDGLGGADTMVGGKGHDTYFVDDSNDVVIELAGSGTGTDTIQTTASFNLLTHGANVENLFASSGAGLTLTGDNLANNISGAGGQDILYGLGGVDILDGGASNDTLDGGAGKDTLTGSFGADVFQFNVDSLVAGKVSTQNTDKITDFNAGAGGDVLDIHNILTGFVHGGSTVSDFITISATGAVKVDVDGAANGHKYVLLANVTGLGGLDVTTLEAAGTLFLG